MKPLLVVATMLVLAATGAALTTRADPAPAHRAPVQVVVTRVERPNGAGGHSVRWDDHLGLYGAQTSWS